MKTKQLLPTKKEVRKLVFEVWKKAVLGTVGLIAIAVAAFLAWLLRGQVIPVPGWILVALSVCALIGVRDFVRWFPSWFRGSNVRLFSSLAPDEQLIVRASAESDCGLSESEIFNLVSVPSQRFSYLIDHLVLDLQIVERTETATGAAFWDLSKKGRQVAAVNNLFYQRPHQSLAGDKST